MRGLISPSKIISNNRGEITPEAFSQFMRGEGNGSLRSSIADSANNIVNFSRSTVAPASPNFSSLLGIISTNINNFKSEINQNIQGQVQNITKNIIQRVEELTKINLNQNVNNAQFTNNAPQISKEDSVEQNIFIQNQIENITQNNQNELKNIAQNINKTFFNTIQRLQTDSQNILSSTIQKFTTEYREQIKETSDNQPSNVLKNFQNLYKSTIDFVTFLGDAKTNNRITKSLVSLRRMFEESLNVSVVIREAIVKIVDQLTNLPSASPSAGGLELDVDVPGGPLKQTGGSLGRTGGRAGLGRRLGLGALGLGIGAAGVGVGAAGAGMLSAKKFQEEKLQSTKAQAQPQEQMIPDDFIRNFQKLIEVFDTSINNLIDFVKSSSGEDGGRTSPGGSNQPVTPISPGATELKSGQYANFINEASKISGLPASQIAAMGDIESSFNPQAISESGARGIMQFMPETYREQYGKYGKQYNLKDDITDPRTSIILGSLYMKNILENYAGGSIEKMVKMYNAGPAGNLSGSQPMEHWRKFQEAIPKYKNLEMNINNTSPQPSTTPQLPTPQATPKPTDQQSSIAPSSKMGTFPYNTVSNPTSNTNEIAFVNLPQNDPLVLPSNGGSNPPSLNSSIGGELANSNVDGISSNNSRNRYLLITKIDLGIV